MANISYSTTSPFGSKVYLAIQAIRGAQATFQRVKQAADSVSAGGTTPANLETSPLFQVASGQGAAFYTAIQSIDAALFATPASWTPVQATVDLDQG